MKSKMVNFVSGLVAGALMAFIVIFCAWIVSMLVNVTLTQLGFPTLSTWGVTAGFLGVYLLRAMYEFISG